METCVQPTKEVRQGRGTSWRALREVYEYGELHTLGSAPQRMVPAIPYPSGITFLGCHPLWFDTRIARLQQTARVQAHNISDKHMDCSLAMGSHPRDKPNTTTFRG